MLFAKVPHFLADKLPITRPYSEIEAWYHFAMETYIGKEHSEREYARMWSWGRDKAVRFIKEIRNKISDDSLSFPINCDQPTTSQLPAKHQPLESLKNSQLQDSTSQQPASDQPNTSQLYIRENKREQTLSLFSIWNEVVSGTPLPSAKKFSQSRQNKCATRMKERSFEEWRELFQRMTTIPFLCGDNDRKWNADFDWIISNEENAVKVLEGKYRNKGGRAAGNDNRYSMFAGA